MKRPMERRMKRMRNRLLTAHVAAAALWTTACSSGGPTITPPPPTGKYSNASLNGTYAFVTSGEAISGTSTISLSRAGSFTANGMGSIQGGVYDVVNGQGTSSTVPITGGTYTVGADGRGTLALNVTSNGGPSTINFAIVLTSTGDGLMIDETANGTQASTGSGNFVLQSSSTFAAGVSGSYVFDFTGLDGNVTTSGGGPFPESLVGQFTASGGVITSGTEDANDGMALATTGSITGTFTPDATNTAAGRGTAVIEGQSYAYYIVDSTRVRFISTNSTGSGPMLSGDAVSRSGVPPAPSGGFAFIVAGASANGGIIRLCRFTVSGGTVNNMLMDVNNAGSENEFGSSSLSNASLTYDSTTGRGTLSFQSSAVNVYEFVFYLDSPSSGVIQEVSPNDTTPAFDVADGSLALQSGSPFTSSNITGPYAMNWSGLVSASGLGTDEEDLLSQVTVSSLKLSGTSDYFQFTGVTLNTNVGTAGSFNLNGGNGTGDDGKPVNLAVNLSGASQINMVVYIVNPQLAFFVSGNNNPTRVVAGILRAQQ